MLKQIIDTVTLAAITAIMGFLIAIIKSIGDVGIEYFKEKIYALALKRGTDKYNSDLAVAKNVWNIVDEYFRITPTVQKTLESAQAKFEEEMLKKIPGLTSDEIDHLRQAIAGEVNQGRDVLLKPVIEPNNVDIDAIDAIGNSKAVSPNVINCEPVTATNNVVSNDLTANVLTGIVSNAPIAGNGTASTVVAPAENIVVPKIEVNPQTAAELATQIQALLSKVQA